MGKFLRLYRETVGTILDTKDLIYLLLGVFGLGGGVTTIVLLQDIPSIWPICATIISGLLIIYSSIKLFLSYKRWHSFKGDVLLDQVMQKFADMHIRLNKVAAEIVASNRKKNIETKEREKIGRDLLRAIGFTDKALWNV